MNRLIAGSEVLGRRIRDAWFGAGPKTAATRLLGAAIPLVLAGSMLRAHPNLWFILGAAWAAAAWRAAPPPKRPRNQAAARAAFVQFIRDCIGDRNGTLLADVLVTAQAAGQLADWDVTRVRDACETVGIPVRESLKVNGRTSVGVHRDDFEAAHPAPSPTPSETPPDEGSSAGQPETTSPTTSPPRRGSVGRTRITEAADDDFEKHFAATLDILGGGR